MFKKNALLILCLFFVAVLTSACGGGGKATPPNNSALYYLLAQQNNQQQANEHPNNNQEENNNNQEQPNNEEEPIVTTDVTLTLTDSLNADKIASADIFYSVDGTTKKSSADDKEISKAEPNADDKTKFTISVNGTAESTKIKAVITYDSNGECLDYFSSYDGVEATNGNFDVDFENSKGDFAGGEGTAEKPYLISTPRHFANINKQDDQGIYLYLDKHFIQTADIDFSHLTGLKIVTADEDKDITIETTNEKAPFYNDGQGNESIGKMSSGTVPPFTGTYDGDNHTIDGLMFVNPKTSYIAIFNIGITDEEPIKKLTIGENSIFFVDKNDEIYNQALTIAPIYALPLSEDAVVANTIDSLENNAKIVVKNVQSSNCSISGITGVLMKTELTNCTNNGHITIYNCKFANLHANGVSNMIYNVNKISKCKNTGKITITKTDFFDNPNMPCNLKIYASGIIGKIQSNGTNIITDCTNKGHIVISNNTDMVLYCGGLIADLYNSSINNLTNSGNITVTNNTLSKMSEYGIYVYGIATMLTTQGVIIGDTFTSEGTVTVSGNDAGYTTYTTTYTGQYCGPAEMN